MRSRFTAQPAFQTTSRSRASGATAARCESPTDPTKCIARPSHVANCANGNSREPGKRVYAHALGGRVCPPLAPMGGGMEKAGLEELTAEFSAVRDEENLDWPRLQGYLQAQKLPGAENPMEVLQFLGGHSNLTYLLRFGSHEWVMRRPPFGPVAPSAHDMAREFRVLSRLWQAFQPAPRAVVLCEDPSIVGAPFFVMERRAGILIKNRRPLPPEIPNDPEVHRRLSEGFVDALAELHLVD